MWILRIFAGLFWALTWMGLGAELLRSLEAGAWRVLSLGELWFTLHVGSLNLMQAVVQRYLWTKLWDPAAIFILQQSVWLDLLAIAVVFSLLWRWRARRRGDGQRKWFNHRKD